MPEIKGYENNVALNQRLDPNSAVRAANATADSQRLAGATKADLGQKIGGSIAYAGEMWQEQRAKEEISHGALAASQLSLGLTSRWNKAVAEADPNNPQVGQQFREELEPDLQSWADSFQTERGKAWAQAQVGALREHFAEKTIADQARLAGVAAQENVRTTVANASNAAQMDPTSVTLQLGLIDSTIEGLAANPNLTPEQVAQMRGTLRPAARKDVVQGAAIGMARANPAAFQEALAKGWGGSDVDAPDRDKLWGYAETLKNAKEQEARQAAVEARRAQKEQFEGAALKLQPKLAPSGQLVYDATFPTQLEELRRQPGADQDRINSMQQAYQASLREEISGNLVQSDPITRQALVSRLGSATDPLTEAEILRARADDTLSNEDTTLLLKGVPGAGSDPAFKQGWSRVNGIKALYKAQVSGSASPLGLTPAGSQRWAEFANRIDLGYQTLVQQGMDPNAAVEQVRKDIPAIAGRYAVSGQEAIKSMSSFMNGGGGQLPPVHNPGQPRAGGSHTYGALTGGGQPAPAGPKIKDGESPEDFLKRTGGE